MVKREAPKSYPTVQRIIDCIGMEYEGKVNPQEIRFYITNKRDGSPNQLRIDLQESEWKLLDDLPNAWREAFIKQGKDAEEKVLYFDYAALQATDPKRLRQALKEQIAEKIPLLPTEEGKHAARIKKEKKPSNFTATIKLQVPETTIPVFYYTQYVAGELSHIFICPIERKKDFNKILKDNISTSLSAPPFLLTAPEESVRLSRFATKDVKIAEALSNKLKELQADDKVELVELKEISDKKELLAKICEHIPTQSIRIA